MFYVNDPLERIMFDELKQHSHHQGFGGFLPGMKQIANVAALPGIVGVSTKLRSHIFEDIKEMLLLVARK